MLTPAEFPSPMRKPLAPYVISLRACFLSVLAPLTIRRVRTEVAEVAETSILPWEHRQIWPCNGCFSCSSHFCWQHKIVVNPMATIMENPGKEVRSAPSSAPKRRFYCAPATELLGTFMACRIQHLYQRGLMSTPGPKSTSWVVVRRSSVWGWTAAKLGVLGMPLQNL